MEFLSITLFSFFILITLNYLIGIRDKTPTQITVVVLEGVILLWLLQKINLFQLSIQFPITSILSLIVALTGLNWFFVAIFEKDPNLLRKFQWANFVFQVLTALLFVYLILVQVDVCFIKIFKDPTRFIAAMGMIIGLFVIGHYLFLKRFPVTLNILGDGLEEPVIIVSETGRIEYVNRLFNDTFPAFKELELEEIHELVSWFSRQIKNAENSQVTLKAMVNSRRVFRGDLFLKDKAFTVSVKPVTLRDKKSGRLIVFYTPAGHCLVAEKISPVVVETAAVAPGGGVVSEVLENKDETINITSKNHNPITYQDILELDGIINVGEVEINPYGSVSPPGFLKTVQKPIRLIIAEDQILLRDTLRLFLGQEPGIEVVSFAENGQKAVDAVVEYHPDLILMDLKMPVLDGIEATRLIKAKYPEIKILICSAYHDEQNIINVMESGADGYILKGISPLELVRTIQDIMSGMKVIHPSVYNMVVKKITDKNKGIDVNL